MPSRVTMRVSMGSQVPLSGFLSWTGRVYSAAFSRLPSGWAQTFMVSVNREGTSTGRPVLAASSHAAWRVRLKVAFFDVGAEVEAGVGSWAFAGALMSESGSANTVTRTVLRRARASNPNTDRGVPTRTLSNFYGVLIIVYLFGNYR